MKSKKKWIIGIIVVIALIIGGMFIATNIDGYLTPSNDKTIDTEAGLTGGIAATVNGTEIEEDEITRTANNTKKMVIEQYGYECPQYLSMYGYSVEDYRKNLIDSFVNEEVMKQYAHEKGVEVTEDEINTEVQKMANKYDSEQAWLEACNERFDDGVEGYKEVLRSRMYEEKLQQAFEYELTNNQELYDEKLLQYVKDNISSYDNAKKSSHILFDESDESRANEVIEKLRSGELSFSDAVAEYSVDTGSAKNNGNVGWDKTNSFISEYTTALGTLTETGQISDVIESQYGYHIIRLDDMYTAPNVDELNDISTIPEAFLEDIKKSFLTNTAQKMFQEWLDAKVEEADVIINDMPDGLPYWTDMDAYNAEHDIDTQTNETSTEENTNADTASVESD